MKANDFFLMIIGFCFVGFGYNRLSDRVFENKIYGYSFDFGENHFFIGLVLITLGVCLLYAGLKNKKN